ncbi:MAG: hypothetical protein ABI608_05780 [Rhizomicrobium sp.]
MNSKAVGVAAIMLLGLGAAASAADLGVEKIATQITARSASRNVQRIEDVHQRMQSAINCLVGPKGEGFDSAAPNPCAASGNGLIPDTAEAGKKDEYRSVVAKLKTGLATDDRGAAMQIALEAADTIVSINDE